MHLGRQTIIRLATLFACLLPNLALADPPARVGRLSFIEGKVTFRTDRQDAGSRATPNLPLTSRANIETEGRSRAEAMVGSTAFRLAESSHLEFTVVDDQAVKLYLGTGALAVTVRDREQAEDISVTTPDGRIRFAGPGRYRIGVHADRTTVAAQSGEANIPAAQPVNLRAGEMAILAGGELRGIEAAPYGDDFDEWVTSRDNLQNAASARRHVSPYMTGYQDLDAYGDWASSGEYGTVWYPRAVGTDWAPFRYGRWIWVAPWGWTWVDAAPWGFAPFHYGRWALIRGRWGWVPGAWVPRPVYAPALVAWIGNPGWSVAFSFGSAPAVGWFPLAPREIYVPSYRASTVYVRQINVTHVTKVREIDSAATTRHRPVYAHRDQSNAVTVVPASHLRDGRPIDRMAVARTERQELRRAPQVSSGPDSSWLAPPARRIQDEPRGQPANGRREAGLPPEARRPPAGEARTPTGRSAPPVQVGNDWPARPAQESHQSGREVRQQSVPHSTQRGGDEQTRGLPAPSDSRPLAPALEARPERQRAQPVPREVVPPAPTPREIQQPQVQGERRIEVPREQRPERSAPVVREVPGQAPAMRREAPQPAFREAGPRVEPQRSAPPREQRHGTQGRGEERERGGGPPRN